MVAEVERAVYTVRNARPEEFAEVGRLLVDVYSRIAGFPTEADEPEYYHLLAHVGELTQNPETELLVATSPEDKIIGAVVYFGDVRHYGTGEILAREQDAAGFRLLAVDATVRGQGVGRLLTNACIEKAKAARRYQLIIHSTLTMQNAWKMYEAAGFTPSPDLDFTVGDLHVFGFRLLLDEKA